MIHQRTGAWPFHTKVALLAAALLFSLFRNFIELTGEVKTAWKWMLPAIMLLATGIALGLSPVGMHAEAWYQSPVSPVSPVSSQATPAILLSPTIPAVTSIQTPASLTEGNAPLPQRSKHASATLIAGGIVLVGLIAGTMVLLIQGQPPHHPGS